MLIKKFKKGEDGILYDSHLFIQKCNISGKDGWTFTIFYPKLHYTWERVGSERPFYENRNIAVASGMLQVYINQDENENIT
jgi:hypothetical protein